MRTPATDKKAIKIEFLTGYGPTESMAVFFYQQALFDEAVFLVFPLYYFKVVPFYVVPCVYHVVSSS